jgi:hypothetical protein|tara:strand:- start:2522 stop:3010 length:489 start_codon:yes stop_codon:yes gene_type:complete
MELKQFSREELMEYLTNGIPTPVSAMYDTKTSQFYFTELTSFINTADNEYSAVITGKYQVTVSIDEIECVILTLVDQNVVFFMAPNSPEAEDMTEKEAEGIIGLVYGVTVHNFRWEQASELASKLILPESELHKLGEGSPLKVNSIEMDNLKEFIKQNKKYM